jgi:polysaccharide biosynthesis transport protein
MREDLKQPGASGHRGGDAAVELAQIYRAVLRKKYIILLSTVLVGASVTLGTARMPKIYAASARLVIDPVLPKYLGEEAAIDGLSEQARSEDRFFGTQFRLMKSRPVLRGTVKRLKLSQDEAFKSAHGLQGLDGESFMKAAEAVVGHLVSVAPEVGSRVVNVEAEDQDPKRAAQLANALSQTYIDQVLADRVETSRGASEWLDERVDELGTQLEEAERKLYDFNKKNMLVSVALEDRRSMSAASLQKLNDKLVDVQTRLLELQADRAVAAEFAARENAIEDAPRLAQNPVVVELKRILTGLHQEEAEFASRYGEKHPKLQAVRGQIADVEGELKKEIEGLRDSFDAEFMSLKRTEESIRGAMDQEKAKVLELNNLGLEYNKLSRDFGTTKSMYENLLKRQVQASMSGLLKSNYVRWLEVAEPNPVAVRPSLPKGVALGLVCGLLLGFGIALGSVLLDNTIRSQSDLEVLAGVPVLGFVPIIEDEGNRRQRGRELAEQRVSPKRDLYTASHPKSTVAECVRAIRTNLMFSATDRPLKRLLLTSAGPSEGKSTVAIALAVSMAQAGNRVLIVDTDLRRARLHRSFGVSGERGLTNALLDESVLDEVIRRTEVAGLDMLPCGPHPPNPAEIIHGERFQALVRALDARYDRIIFDSPPVNVVTDAVILSQIVDGTLVVAKAGETPKDAFRRMVRQLRDVEANILGTVLNGVSLGQDEYARYSYYHYYRPDTYGQDEQGAGA